MPELLTLPMLSIMAVTELRHAAQHRDYRNPGVVAGPVFLGPVHTEAYWQVARGHPEIRRCGVHFRLVEMRTLFDDKLRYPLLERLEAHVKTALWILVHHLHVVDGSSFVSLPIDDIAAPVYAAQDSMVALILHIEGKNQHLHLSAGVVRPREAR